MIPEYLTFIRYQDRKFLIFIYLTNLFLLGLYWNNAGNAIAAQDAVVVSGMLAILFFKIIYELKAYWAYKCVVGTVDLSFFADKKLITCERFITHPLVPGLIAWLFFCGIIKSYFLLLTPATAQLALFVSAPLFIYFAFRLIRNSYIKQVGIAAVDKVRYKSLYRYVFSSIVLSLALTLLSITPLQESEKFTLKQGFFSARLMVAMWILCTIILLLNMFFMQFSKRYIFLGRMFLNEIDFSFSTSIPFPRIYRKPQWYKLMLLFIVEALWIGLISALTQSLQISFGFAVWFLLCFLPCLSYYAVYLYWLWHNDFMMACDMYLRWGEIKKQDNFW